MFLSAADMSSFKDLSKASQATVCSLQTFLSLLCAPSKSAPSLVWETKTQFICLSVITNFDDSSSGTHMLLPHPAAHTLMHTQAQRAAVVLYPQVSLSFSLQ